MNQCRTCGLPERFVHADDGACIAALRVALEQANQTRDEARATHARVPEALLSRIANQIYALKASDFHNPGPVLLKVVEADEVLSVVGHLRECIAAEVEKRREAEAERDRLRAVLTGIYEFDDESDVEWEGIVSGMRSMAYAALHPTPANWPNALSPHEEALAPAQPATEPEKSVCGFHNPAADGWCGYCGEVDHSAIKPAQPASEPVRPEFGACGIADCRAFSRRVDHGLCRDCAEYTTRREGVQP